MIAVVQRVQSAKVMVEGVTTGEIGVGLVALAAIHADDMDADIQWMAAKLVSMRIFPNGDKYFDQDVKAIGGRIFLVSNFTVAAETHAGRRPSLSPAASPAEAEPMFESLLAAVKAQGVRVATGVFGAHMLVEIANDGPVTFIVDSRQSRKPAP